MRILTALLLSSTAFIANAQQKKPEITLYGSASQVPIEAPKVGASVSLITSEEIENLGIRSAADALRLLPGVHVSQQGGKSGLTYARLRGGETRHTLILVDGIAINDSGDGAADLSQFSTSDIERIEVIRGPQSGIHGAQAHSGVISITTKSGKGFGKPQVEASFEHGTLNTQNVSLSARGQKDRVNAAFHVFGERTSGYNVAYDGYEKDGAQNYGFSNRFGFQFNDAWRLDTSLRHTHSYKKFDSDFGTLFDGNDYGLNRITVGRATLNYLGMGGAWTHALSTDFNHNARSNIGTWFASHSTTRSYSTQYKSNVLFNAFGANNRFIYGADYKNEGYQYDDGFAPLDKTRVQKGVFAEYLMDFATGTSLSGAVRQDFHSHFENAFTYRATLSQEVKPLNGRLHTSFGKGVTNPTFFDTFGYAGFSIANLNLKQETSHGFDIGYEQKLLNGRVMIDATYFYKRMTNAFYNGGTWPNIQRLNATNTTNRQGIELSGRALITDWLSITAAYTYIIGQDNVGMQPIRIPNHAFTLTANARFMNDRANLSLGLVHNGKMGDKDYSFFPVPLNVMLREYTKVSANLSYDFTKNMTGFIRAENLLNQRYEEAYTYRASPFEAFVGVKVKLD